MQDKRTCHKCKIVKSLTEFGRKFKNKEIRQYTCKTCMYAYQMQQYYKNPNRRRKIRQYAAKSMMAIRNYVLQYLSDHPCVDCAESDIVVLEFDHRDRSTKIAQVADLIRLGSMDAVIKEIAKCDVRCCNCHRRKTYIQLGWKSRTKK